MKNKNLMLSLGSLVGAAALLSQSASAQTFQTVDDFNLYPAWNCDLYAMGRDPFGNIYAAGYMGIGARGESVAGLRKSSDGGASWSVIDLYSQGGSTLYDEYNSFASDAAGNLYAAGQNLSRDLFVRRSGDGGATWSTVDTLAGSGSVGDAASDAAGNVYVVGVVRTNIGGSTVAKWVVRKGIGGASWSTSDFFDPGNGASARAVLCHPAGVFVYGSGSVKVKKDLVSYGYVRRSQNGGGTWTTVNTTATTVACAMGADAAGNIYLAGHEAGHWIIRKSSNGGTSWTTVDDFQMCVTTVTSTKPYRTQTTCYNAFPSGFAADAFGNLFVVGSSDSPTGTRWIVRKSVGGTGPWQTVNEFQYAPGKGTPARGIVADDTGHVFVGGYGNSVNGPIHWLVRRN